MARWPLFFEGINAAPDNHNWRLGNSFGLSQETDGNLAFSRASGKRHLYALQRWIEIARGFKKIFLRLSVRGQFAG